MYRLIKTAAALCVERPVASSFAIQTHLKNAFVEVCTWSPFVLQTHTNELEFDGGGIGIVEYLNRTNILALVGGGKTPMYPPNKVMIWDDHQVQCIAELAFASGVKAVRLRKDRFVKIQICSNFLKVCRIIVVLTSKVYIYDFTDLNLIDQLDTVANERGIQFLFFGKDIN